MALIRPGKRENYQSDADSSNRFDMEVEKGISRDSRDEIYRDIRDELYDDLMEYDILQKMTRALNDSIERESLNQSDLKSDQTSDNTDANR